MHICWVGNIPKQRLERGEREVWGQQEQLHYIIMIRIMIRIHSTGLIRRDINSDLMIDLRCVAN